MTRAQVSIAVAASGGNLTRAARALGVELSTLRAVIGKPDPRGRPRRQFDADAIGRALATSGGNVSRAARILGAPEGTLRDFLRRETGKARK